METYTNWRGTAIGPTQAFDITAPYGSDFGWKVDVSSRTRTGQTALFEAVTAQPLTRDILIRPGTGAGSDMDDWRAAAVAFFSPFLGSTELAADFDGDTRTTIAVITGINQHPQIPMRADVQGALQAQLVRFSPYWRSAAQSTTSLTVTNAGNAPANPTITIKPTTGTVLRRRVTFAENTGRGLVNHPIRLTVNTTSAGPIAAGSDVLIFDQGNPTLFQSQNLNNASTLFDIRKSLRPASTDEFVDVVYGTAVNNTVTANALLPWGFDWAHASFSNTVWVYRATATTINGVTAPAIWEVSRAPQIPGVWFPVRFGGTGTSDAWNETTGNVQIVSHAALALNTQIRAVTANALQGVTSTIDNLGVPTGEVHYRLWDATNWTPAALTTSGSFPTFTLDDVDIPAAADVALTAHTATDSFTTWSEQASSAPIRITLESGDVPTLSVDSSATTMARINGRLTNTTTGDYVDIFDLYIDADASGGLVIDTLAGGVEKNWVHPSLSTSPMYSGSGGRGWAFSNPAGLPLVPGANVLAWQGVGTGTGSGDGAPTITTVWSDTYL